MRKSVTCTSNQYILVKPINRLQVFHGGKSLVGTTKSEFLRKKPGL